jgi:2-polyprenyl-3-methyl-5-hydroxy-6-metoxy-1,4-benzoquinol methylase
VCIVKRTGDPEKHFPMKQWYEALFENYAEKYDAECYTQGTSGECDFIEQEARFDKSLRILDMGCGTGRHAIELTRRGYNVTGVDLSESMLGRAKVKAAALGLTIDFRQGDARYFSTDDEFDLVMMICEGAFPLMESDEMNFRILSNVSQSLKFGGKLIFTTLNGLFPLFHSVKDFLESQKIEGNASTLISNFDLLTFRDHNVTMIVDDNGKEISLNCSERYYVPPEISWLLHSLGYRQISFFGAKLGAFSRNDKLTPDDFEMLVVADK